KNLQIMAAAENFGKGKIPSGPFAEWEMKLKKAITQFTGESFKGVPQAEIIQKIGTQLAGAAAKADFGSRVAQAEFLRYMESGVPNLSQTPEGRKLLLDIMIQDAK